MKTIYSLKTSTQNMSCLLYEKLGYCNHKVFKDFIRLYRHAFHTMPELVKIPSEETGKGGRHNEVYYFTDEQLKILISITRTNEKSLPYKVDLAKNCK